MLVALWHFPWTGESGGGEAGGAALLSHVSSVGTRCSSQQVPAGGLRSRLPVARNSRLEPLPPRPWGGWQHPVRQQLSLLHPADDAGAPRPVGDESTDPPSRGWSGSSVGHVAEQRGQLVLDGDQWPWLSRASCSNTGTGRAQSKSPRPPVSQINQPNQDWL